MELREKIDETQEIWYDFTQIVSSESAAFGRRGNQVRDLNDPVTVSGSNI